MIKYDEFSSLVKSPQTRGLIFQILGIIAAAGVVWVVIAAILSLIKAWVVVLLAIVMGIVVFIREGLANRREDRIQQGFCAQCGYDLQGKPERCPQCGRDASLDEPVWRRSRRELEAKLLASVDQVQAPVETPVPNPAVRVVAKRPPVDDAPIPLEGDDL